MWLCASSRVNISDFPFPVPFSFPCSTFFFKLLFQIYPHHLNFNPCWNYFTLYSLLSCQSCHFPLHFVQFLCIAVKRVVKVYACKSSNSMRRYWKLQLRFPKYQPLNTEKLALAVTLRTSSIAWSSECTTGYFFGENRPLHTRWGIYSCSFKVRRFSGTWGSSLAWKKKSGFLKHTYAGDLLISSLEKANAKWSKRWMSSCLVPPIWLEPFISGCWMLPAWSSPWVQSLGNCKNTWFMRVINL